MDAVKTVRPRIDVLFGFAYLPDVRVRRTTQTLAKAGYRVRIFAWDRSGTLAKSELDGRVHVRRIHVASRSGRGWTQLLFLAQAVARYVPYIVRRPPDVLHAVDLPMLVAAIIIAPLTRKRPVIVFDAFEIYAVMESHKYPRWLLGLLHLAERVLPRFADLVITAGESRRRYFEDRGISSVAVPNWVAPPTRSIDRVRARRHLNLPPDAVVVLYAGGLDPSRDLVSLVEHARRYPSHIALIAGQGEQEPSLREAAELLPNLRLLGWLPDPSLALAAADAMYYSLVPSHPYAEFAAPNNLYTAISHAVPLVYRAHGEIDLVARNHYIGAAFHDAATLDAAIAQVTDPETNAKIREGLRRLRRHYSPDVAAARLLVAYRGVVDRVRRSESTNGV